MAPRDEPVPIKAHCNASFRSCRASRGYVAVRLLKHLGYDAVAVAGGQEALDYLRSVTPKLIILDCHMPCVGGLDVLRANAALASVPVVMFSADADNGDREAIHQLGIHGWIVKVMDWENIAHFAKLYA
jgi:CheY-like chemotaxis protein